MDLIAAALFTVVANVAPVPTSLKAKRALAHGAVIGRVDRLERRRVTRHSFQCNPCVFRPGTSVLA
jgi:hypothetical protein